ncbi:DUF6728 family protein [Gynurincola endophyticus]|jgi:hypothetical protein|uniref:DUF6728 family protein n=1 Tax=Gynurincola endophyticus TaxID=2479004 RepID=UPI0018F27C05|nr:DUF6728 family protein [Gynurincola endophyticus]
MGVWKQIGEYLFIKKKDPNRPDSGFVRYMHGMNRISIFMFLIAIVIIIVKLLVG